MTGLVQLFEKEGYPLARCRSCELVQVGVEVDPARLEEIYGEAYFKEEVFHDYVAERDDRLKSGAQAARTLAAVKPGGRLLDVGCATGFFLQAASTFYEVKGVELSPFAAEYARNEFGLDVLVGDVTEVGSQEEPFDVVTLWNTIEHMADPVGALRAIASLSRPGTLLAISTGDVSGPLARRDLPGWNLMSPPYHLFFFSPRTIDLLLARAGFRLRRIVYDGVVAAAGPFASSPGRRIATLLGLGNVMTVYATFAGAPLPALSRAGRVAARYRPLSRAFGA